MMQVYLVGGAVRDALLGQPTQDRDWVVVGASPQWMLEQGFAPVGRDFPVFLHPRTREEWALARTERKTGAGYHGFQFDAAPDVTLEQDLARRDLTINAIAVQADCTVMDDQVQATVPPDPHQWARDGRMHDPFGGQADLRAGRLRHVSPAFREDPVRILRLARLAARWPAFFVDADTETLLRAMVQSGEVDHLVPERVWQELARGLMQPQPSRMLQVLQRCGAWERLVSGAVGTASVERALDAAARLTAPLPVRAALLGVEPRLRMPSDCAALAVLLQRHGTALLQGADASPEQRLSALTHCDALRQPERFEHLLLALQCQQAGNDGVDAVLTRWRRSLAAALSVATRPIAEQAYAAGSRGTEIGAALREARLVRMRALD